MFDPRGGQWMDGRYVPSLLAAIGGVIERHLVDQGFMKPGNLAGEAPPDAPTLAAIRKVAQCPKCGAATLAFQEGCATCLTCGHSTCS